MGVLIVTNARSGRGRAKRLGEAIAGALDASGEAPEVRDVRELAAWDAEAGARLAPFQAVLVVGGDGTLHHLLGALAACGAPVYHVPAGTENLFAREFGMTSDPEALRAALRARRTRPVDLATAGGRRFGLMVSVGPDAGVIHRLHARRSRAAGHTMYVRPIAAEVLRPHLTRLRVRVDGRELVDGRPGLLVAANCRQYARRLNPASEADMSDGLLDVAFMPASTSAGVIGWGLRCARRRQRRGPGFELARGARVEIASESGAPWQCDGEAGGWLTPGEPLEISIEPASMNVLLPA